MGGDLISLGVLASAVTSIQRFVQVFFSVYQFILLAYILLSWFPRVPSGMAPVQRFLHDVCEPYLRPFRRIVPSLGPLDLSPLVGFIALGLIELVVIKVLDQFR